MDEEEESGLSWRDVLAFVIALLTTQLLPVIIILIMIVALTVIFFQLI